MEDYYTIIISQKELHATEKFKETDWVSWCWEHIGIDNFSWTIDWLSPRITSQTDLREVVNYVYIIRFEYEEDKLLFILNWL